MGQGIQERTKEATYKWVEVFKNGPRKIWGTQPLKNLKLYGLLRQTS